LADNIIIFDLGGNKFRLEARNTTSGGGDTLAFFDDLDSSAQGEKEQEADKLAEEALIPRKTWKRFIESEVTPGGIAELALQLNIHPAIVAGRWQHETGNFRRFSRMVGRQQVRRHYPEISWV